MKNKKIKIIYWIISGIILFYIMFRPIRLGPSYEERKLNNLRILHRLCFLYTYDNNNLFPEKLEDVCYKKDLRTLLFDPLNENTNKVCFKLMVNGNINDYKSISNTVEIAEIEPDTHGKRAIIYMDGHIELIAE